MIPKYVYHYTSIETLKEIIKTNNIRFTRLDKLNDPYEGLIESDDINLSSGEIRKCAYCSCWTTKPQENLALWAMYTNMKGVRIKLKSNLFADKILLVEQENCFMPIQKIAPITSYYTIFDQQPNIIHWVYGPFKVDYVETLKDTYKCAIDNYKCNENTPDETLMHNIFTFELGQKKVNHWEYENEWRYKISLPVNFSGSAYALSKISAEMIISPEFIDIPLKAKIEEILVGPEVTEQETEELNEFLKAQKLSIEIKKSDIRVNRKRT